MDKVVYMSDAQDSDDDYNEEKLEQQDLLPGSSKPMTRRYSSKNTLG